MPEKKIFVTRPSLPPLDELMPYLEEIWRSKDLTNGAKFHKSFELKLAEFLNVSNISLFSSGTTALITALKALAIKGEVITTPFSFVATSHALVWNGITPVFVDIEPDTLNLDPSKIECAITSRTSAILATHVYGIPCATSSLEKIAREYNLKIIYDAAHSFGVEVDSNSILNFGDLSILSFHATKVFTTFEGGAIVSSTSHGKLLIDELKNFGFTNEVSVDQVGINGKLNEFCAATGLLQLNHISSFIEKRRIIDELYRSELEHVEGLRLHPIPRGVKSNFSYFPIFVGENFRCSRDQLYFSLRDKGIYARRYFYPLITEFNAYKRYKPALSHDLKVASKAAREVICLPIFPDMSVEDLKYICTQIRGN
jgi:dTDP-4-amino-4,6-dideoxygalactose transaminase